MTQTTSENYDNLTQADEIVLGFFLSDWPNGWDFDHVLSAIGDDPDEENDEIGVYVAQLYEDYDPDYLRRDMRKLRDTIDRELNREKVPAEAQFDVTLVSETGTTVPMGHMGHKIACGFTQDLLKGQTFIMRRI